MYLDEAPPTIPQTTPYPTTTPYVPIDATDETPIDKPKPDGSNETDTTSGTDSSETNLVDGGSDTKTDSIDDVKLPSTSVTDVDLQPDLPSVEGGNYRRVIDGKTTDVSEPARNEAEKVISPSNVLHGATEPPSKVTTQKASLETDQTTDFFLDVTTTTERPTEKMTIAQTEQPSTTAATRDADYAVTQKSTIKTLTEEYGESSTKAPVTTTNAPSTTLDPFVVDSFTSTTTQAPIYTVTEADGAASGKIVTIANLGKEIGNELDKIKETIDQIGGVATDTPTTATVSSFFDELDTTTEKSTESVTRVVTESKPNGDIDVSTNIKDEMNKVNEMMDKITDGGDFIFDDKTTTESPTEKSTREITQQPTTTVSTTTASETTTKEVQESTADDFFEDFSTTQSTTPEVVVVTEASRKTDASTRSPKKQVSDKCSVFLPQNQT